MFIVTIYIFAGGFCYEKENIISDDPFKCYILYEVSTMLNYFKQSLLGILVICFLGIANPVFAFEGDVPIYLNGVEQSTAALSINEKNFVPLRSLCNMILCEISYENQSKEIVIYQGNNSWHLHIGSSIVDYCADSNIIEELKLSIAPISRQGHIYIPLADVAKLLNCDVSWNSTNRVVDVKMPLIYRNKQWLTNDGQAIEQLDSYQKIDDTEFVVLSVGSLDTPLASQMVVFALQSNGTGRRIAAANSIVGKPVIADKCCYILEYNPITWSSHVTKTSMLNSKERIILGEGSGWTYSYLISNYISPIDGSEELLSHPDEPPFIVKEDGVYVSAWELNGFAEEELRDINILSSSYGIYKLPKNGGKQELISLFELDWLQ